MMDRIAVHPIREGCPELTDEDVGLTRVKVPRLSQFPLSTNQGSVEVAFCGVHLGKGRETPTRLFPVRLDQFAFSSNSTKRYQFGNVSQTLEQVVDGCLVHSNTSL